MTGGGISENFGGVTRRHHDFGVVLEKGVSKETAGLAMPALPGKQFSLTL